MNKNYDNIGRKLKIIRNLFSCIHLLEEDCFLQKEKNIKKSSQGYL